MLNGTFSNSRKPVQNNFGSGAPFNEEQNAVRRKEYFVLVTMNQETIRTPILEQR